MIATRATKVMSVPITKMTVRYTMLKPTLAGNIPRADILKPGSQLLKFYTINVVLMDTIAIKLRK